jgi:hypothetical protein
MTRHSRYDCPRVPEEVRARVAEIRRAVRDLRQALDQLTVDPGTATGIALELARLAHELEDGK